MSARRLLSGKPDIGADMAVGPLLMLWTAPAPSNEVP